MHRVYCGFGRGLKTRMTCQASHWFCFLVRLNQWNLEEFLGTGPQLDDVMRVVGS